jgi:hypothetical protein
MVGGAFVAWIGDLSHAAAFVDADLQFQKANGFVARKIQ